MRNYVRWIGFTVLLMVVNVASAQSWGPRSLEELKEETLTRARAKTAASGEEARENYYSA